MFDFISFIPRVVVQSIPLMYGSTGETITQKSGNLNLGIPGVMYVGAISGVIGAFLYEHGCSASGTAMSPVIAVLIPLFACLLGSLLMGLLYCFLTVTLCANQNVTGLAMTTFGIGFGNFFGGSLMKLTGADVPSIALTATSNAFRTMLPGALSTGWFGKVFLSYGFLAYAAIIISLAAAWFLRSTRTGLQLRAVGESPATADAAGINITKYKYAATCLGCMIAGLGGLYLYHLASGYRNPVVPSLRRSVHPLSVHSHRYKPGGQGNLQDVPLYRHHRRAHHNQHAQQEGEPAAGSSGPALFP